VLGLPASAKNRGASVKPLLLESCRDLLPPSVYQRNKMGFALPMDSWMRGPLRSFVEEGLREATARAGLREDAMEALHGQFQQQKLHWTRIWSLVVLGHYLQRVAEAERPADLPQAVRCEFSAPSAP
jgi:asparagine synthase (glutamine-hydrolysing)